MDSKVKKILSSILMGQTKVFSCLRKFQDLELRLKDRFDYNISVEKEESYNQFKINLFNYYRSISDQKKYFEEYEKVSRIINKTIVLDDDMEKSYTFDTLFRAFRNLNEHYDKTNCETEYELFQKYISKDDLLELFKCCNEVLNHELKKLTADELLSLFFMDTKVKTSYSLALDKLAESNENAKEQSKELYSLNVKMIEKYRTILSSDISLDNMDEIFKSLELYLANPTYKDMFVNRYGIELYDYLVNMFTDDDSNIEQDKEKLNYILNATCEIEKNIKNNENK